MFSSAFCTINAAPFSTFSAALPVPRTTAMPPAVRVPSATSCEAAPAAKESVTATSRLAKAVLPDPVSASVGVPIRCGAPAVETKA